MLVLVESIRRTLCTSCLKLKSVLVSEVAQVWIITLPAFTVLAHGEGTCSPLFCLLQAFPPRLPSPLSLPPCFPLACLIGDSTVCSSSSFCPVRLCFCLQVHALVLPHFPFPLFIFLNIPPFPKLSLFSVSPHALRSTTQQPLNYSHQTTLCIFCAVPLHPSRIFPVSHGRLCACLCTCPS